MITLPLLYNLKQSLIFKLNILIDFAPYTVAVQIPWTFFSAHIASGIDSKISTLQTSASAITSILAHTTYFFKGQNCKKTYIVAAELMAIYILIERSPFRSKCIILTIIYKLSYKYVKPTTYVSSMFDTRY